MKIHIRNLITKFLIKIIYKIYINLITTNFHLNHSKHFHKELRYNWLNNNNAKNRCNLLNNNNGQGKQWQHYWLNSNGERK